MENSHPKDMQMENKHMKDAQCHKGNENENHKRYLFTLTKMAIGKKMENNKDW